MTAQDHRNHTVAHYMYLCSYTTLAYTIHVEMSGTTCYICICLTTAVNQMVNSFQTLVISFLNHYILQTPSIKVHACPYVFIMHSSSWF